MTTPLDNAPVVRPFLLTGGRTRGAGGDLPIETMVVAPTDSDPLGLEPEKRSIVERCGEAISIAEISAHMAMPVGVIRVLVSDLTQSAHLEQFETAADDDITIVRRLLDGIRSRQ